METAAAARVQHVTKASSDELLSKFAEVGSDDHPKKQSKRQKRAQSTVNQESSDFGGVLVERKSLLPSMVAGRRSSGAVVRQIKVGRAHFRSRNFKNRSFLGTIEKTWRRTVEGASKVFMEKHYNRHKRLISDV